MLAKVDEEVPYPIDLPECMPRCGVFLHQDLYFYARAVPHWMLNIEHCDDGQLSWRGSVLLFRINFLLVACTLPVPLKALKAVVPSAAQSADILAQVIYSRVVVELLRSELLSEEERAQRRRGSNRAGLPVRLHRGGTGKPRSLRISALPFIVPLGLPACTLNVGLQRFGNDSGACVHLLAIRRRKRIGVAEYFFPAIEPQVVLGRPERGSAAGLLDAVVLTQTALPHVNQCPQSSPLLPGARFVSVCEQHKRNNTFHAYQLLHGHVNSCFYALRAREQVGFITQLPH